MTPRRRRTAFALILLALLFVAVELVAYVGLGWIDGSWFDLAGLQAARGRRSGDAVPVSEPNPVAEAMPWVGQGAVHPYLGFVQDPTRDASANDFGFIETEIPLQRRADDRLIVGVFGGSFALQFRQLAVDALLEPLLSQPRFAGRRPVVVATALGGYKQPQQLMALSYLLALGGEFDVVVNIDGFNEVALHAAENEPKGVFPSYPRSWYFRTAELNDERTLERVAAIASIRGERSRSARFFSRAPQRYLASCNLLWRVLDRRRGQRLARLTVRLQADEARDDRYVATGPQLDPASGDVYDHLVAVWRESSLQMARLCRANGIVYVHALQPNQYVEGSKPMGAAERRVALGQPHPYRPGVEAGYPRLVEAGRRLVEQGVNFLDLSLAYAGVDEPLYVDRCCHVNRRGYAILAPSIAEAVIRGFEEASTTKRPR